MFFFLVAFVLLLFVIAFATCHHLCKLLSPFVAHQSYYSSSLSLFVITLVIPSFFCCSCLPYYLSSLLLFDITLLFVIALLLIVTLLLVITFVVHPHPTPWCCLKVHHCPTNCYHPSPKQGTNTTSTCHLVIHHHLVAHFISPLFVVMVFPPNLQCACYLQLEHYGVCKIDSLCTLERRDFFSFWFVGFSVYEL